MKEKLELRMYGLVPYNISEIQKGIQFGHAVVEYSQNINTLRITHDAKIMLKLKSQLDDKYNQIGLYDDWADNWKTFIILNGGTSNHSVNRYTNDAEYLGNMETHLSSLKEAGILTSEFYEPDLNDMLSAIVFIVDERVFNKKDYPDFEDWVIDKYGSLLKGVNLYSSARKIKESDDPNDIKIYKEWVNIIGGDKNLFLREFLKNFRLA